MLLSSCCFILLFSFVLLFFFFEFVFAFFVFVITFFFFVFFFTFFLRILLLSVLLFLALFFFARHISCTLRHFFYLCLKKKNRIPPDTRLAVYCTAIANGQKSDWEFAFEQYRNTSSDTEKVTMLLGMTCSRDPEILKR